ncbi:uncharacterized protein BP5553_10468 [Venustampulla echinocandica]|uniref:Reverse transcriptase RNase H-like domain-containing protein n=1 Tax=Venustampulla echinocandica TaxID=2656787 RepID=A0A370T9E2_9HELO|nr:uncharacterized protein BP5553_10468 [Venustampulla echinocandica]RDL30190.1 hypothetical protein BP5553_10468 [Venustampulla echinocandica]
MEKCEFGVTETAFLGYLKDRFAEELVIVSFHEDRLSIVETDTSDTAVGAAHFQLDENGKLYPVTYYSEKHSLAEQNYDIYKKELMAIVKALRHWKIYLQSAKFPITIRTDYANLRTFMTTKVLDNRRMARWAEELSQFDLRIKHVKGIDNPRADTLSKQPRYEGDKVYKKVAIFREDKDGNLVPNTKEIAALSRTKGP